MTDQKFLADLGSRIKQLRSEKGITQNGLAILCGFEKANMSRIEAGKTNISILTLRKICGALKVRISDFFTE